MKRIIIIILVLTAIIGTAVAINFLFTPKPYSVAEDPEIEVITVKTDTIVSTVNASARLEALDTANEKFEVAGKVAKILVAEGDHVKTGDLLAQLDTIDLELAVKLAEIELARAQAEQDKLTAPPEQIEVDSAQAGVDSAKANLASIMEGSATETDIQAAQTVLNSAKANLQRVMAGPNTDSVTVAAAGLRKAQIALKQAQEAYNKVAYDSDMANAQGEVLQQATIDYETALANYNLAVKSAENADILAAQSEVANAQANLQKLIDGPKTAEVVAAQAQILQAEAALAKLVDGPSEADVIMTQAAVDTAKVRLEEAKRSLKNTQLLSTMDGVVTVVNIKENDAVAIPAATPAIALADLSAFKLEIEIDEIDINRIAPGQPVTITLDSLPGQEFAGQVDQVLVAPSSGASGGIVAYPVKVLVDSGADAPFKIGMNVNATIETERLENVIVVPNRAIQLDRETGSAYIEKVENDQDITRTEVTLGQRDTQQSQILNGLAVGDVIAIRQTSRRDQLMNVMSGE